MRFRKPHFNLPVCHQCGEVIWPWHTCPAPGEVHYLTNSERFMRWYQGRNLGTTIVDSCDEELAQRAWDAGRIDLLLNGNGSS